MKGSLFKITGQSVLHEAKWLRLLQYDYVDPSGTTRSWELCERTTRAGTTDAVDILAVLERSKQADHVVLVKQYRPPIKGWTIEMPAGLVDSNESVEEETGYHSQIVRNADPIVESDPGITNANLQLVEVVIDGDLAENADPKPAVDDMYIETVLLPIPKLKQELDSFVAQGLHVDSRLYHFAAGLDFANRMKL